MGFRWGMGKNWSTWYARWGVPTWGKTLQAQAISTWLLTLFEPIYKCHGVRQMKLKVDVAIYIPRATLDSLSLIQYHIMPFDSLEIFDVLYHKLITSDQYVEFSLAVIGRTLAPKLAQDSSVLWITPIWHSLEKKDHK